MRLTHWLRGGATLAAIFAMVGAAHGQILIGQTVGITGSAAATVADVAPVSEATALAEGWQAVLNPADTRDLVGWVRPATANEVASARPPK